MRCVASGGYRMPGEMFRTPYEPDVGGAACDEEREFARSLRGMIHVPRIPDSAVDGDIVWAWLRPEMVSYVESPRLGSDEVYRYRWRVDGVWMDSGFYVGPEYRGELSSRPALAVSLEDRVKLMELVDMYWEWFYGKVVCGSFTG